MLFRNWNLIIMIFLTWHECTFIKAIYFLECCHVCVTYICIWTSIGDLLHFSKSEISEFPSSTKRSDGKTSIQYLKESLQLGEGGEQETGDWASSSGLGERTGMGSLVCSGLGVVNAVAESASVVCW